MGEMIEKYLYHFELWFKIINFTEFIAKPEALKLLDENWDLIAPYFLDYNYTIPKEKHVEVARLIRNYYFESNKIDETTLKHLIDVASDRFFITDGEKAARMQAKVNRQPVWFYYYTYKGAHSISEIMSGTSNKYGIKFRFKTSFLI